MLDPLFLAQKRAIRTLAPGFVNYYYNRVTGELPLHTKPVFTGLQILSVHNVVLQHLLVTMCKITLGFSPVSVSELFTKKDIINVGLGRKKYVTPPAWL